MGEFIDFGEPRDKNWREDFGRFSVRIAQIGGSVVKAYETNLQLRTIKECPSPWEEAEHIRKAIYSVQMAKRCQTINIKHIWIWERNTEINKLRNALYTQVLRAKIRVYDMRLR